MTHGSHKIWHIFAGLFRYLEQAGGAHHGARHRSEVKPRDARHDINWENDARGRFERGHVITPRLDIAVRSAGTARALSFCRAIMSGDGAWSCFVDVAYINAFVKAVKDVLMSTVHIPVTRCTPHLKEWGEKSHKVCQVSVCIGLSGPVNGVVVASFTEHVACQLASLWVVQAVSSRKAASYSQA